MAWKLVRWRQAQRGFYSRQLFRRPFGVAVACAALTSRINRRSIHCATVRPSAFASCSTCAFSAGSTRIPILAVRGMRTSANNDS
jgi:hypothetical protein